MTLLPSTIALLSCLLVATLLGGGIGACLWHLRLARRHDSALQRLSRSGEREREALATMLSQEREAFASKYEQQTRRLRQERERAERAVARAEDLAGRERRVEKLDARVGAPDALRDRQGGRERGIPSAGSSARQHHSLGEERLPVLRRRVDSARPSLDGDLLALEGEHEIPMLAESDLPDSVDDLVFELLDTERASAAAEHGARLDATDPDATDPDLASHDVVGPESERDER